MTRNKKIIIIATITVLIVIVAWAPWLNNQSLHDKVFEERGWKDGTITTPEHFENLSDEALQGLLAESRKKGVENGILICDYNVNWFPFGRYIASCEGGYFATFWGKILFPESVAVENPCAVCINGCDTCPEGCEECLIGIEKKLKDPNLKWYYNPDFFIPSFNEEGKIEFKAQEDQIELLDERLGYEMKYPSTWSITEERKDFGIELSRTVFQSKDYQETESEEYKEVVATGGETGLLQPTVMSGGAKLEVLITEIPPNFKWRDWAKRATDYPYGKLVSERFLILEGKEIYERQVESREATSIVISFPGLEEAKLFELILHTLKKDEGKNLETLNQILSTFRFLE